MILIKLDKQSKRPLFRQIKDQVQDMIINGDLREGERLPATRSLSKTLGVHRTTVFRAYEELWAAGYLESTAGGYSRVRRRNEIAKKTKAGLKDGFDWTNHFSDSVNLLQNQTSGSLEKNNDLIDFRLLSPDSDLLPVDDFRKCMNQAFITEGTGLLQYGDPSGYRPLREYLARQMGQHGISVDADEIMLTNGMQNGIEMVLRLLTNPGDVVVTESPTYSSALSLMRYLGLKVVGIPVRNNGLNMEELERQMMMHHPRLIYSMPTFHNPTGLTTSQSHREALLALCNKYQVPLVEDGFEEELKYFGKAVLPVKSMDQNGIVIYLGTFSKVLFPGVRVGWIVGPRPLCEKLSGLKQVSSLSDSQVTQASIHQFCERGFYELHKKRIHRVYRKRMQVALAACRESLPNGFVRFTKPEGGYLVWLTLDLPVSEESKINEMLVKHGVALTPGSRFFANQPKKVHFRISIAHRKEDEIIMGIQRMGNLFKHLMSHAID